MKRDFNVPKGQAGCEAGDEYAASMATALAQLADGPTIEKFVEAVSMLDLFGGQLYIQAVRAKFDADGQVIPDEEATSKPGRWSTAGYVFRFDTVDAAVMAGKDKAFVVPGPIQVKPSDDVELARKAALGQTPAADATPEPETAPTE